MQWNLLRGLSDICTSPTFAVLPSNIERMSTAEGDSHLTPKCRTVVIASSVPGWWTQPKSIPFTIGETNSDGKETGTQINTVDQKEERNIQPEKKEETRIWKNEERLRNLQDCLLYTSDAADECRIV